MEYVAAAREGARNRDLVAFAVTEAFYKIVGLDSLIATTQFSRQSLEAHHRQIQERISVGKAARVDLLRIAVRLADLDQITAEIIELIVLPLRVRDGDGSPVRAVAIEETEDS